MPQRKADGWAETNGINFTRSIRKIDGDEFVQSFVGRSREEVMPFHLANPGSKIRTSPSGVSGPNSYPRFHEVWVRR